MFEPSLNKTTTQHQQHESKTPKTPSSTPVGSLERERKERRKFLPKKKRNKRKEKRREEKMGSRLGRRIIHFANLPIKLLPPTTFDNIREIAIKTIPSATKIEIKRVLESLYGFHVDKVHTLNMEGKKKKRGGILMARPDYKKAYVTLGTPLSLSPDLFPIRVLEEEKDRTNKRDKATSVIEERQTHWLDGRKEEKGKWDGRREWKGKGKGKGRGVGGAGEAVVKFPWSSMKSVGAGAGVPSSSSSS